MVKMFPGRNFLLIHRVIYTGFQVGFPDCHESIKRICLISVHLLQIFLLLSILKECIFKKTSDTTGLRVFWNGNLRLSNCHGCCRRWYFTFNGAECSAPAAIDGIVFMVYGNSGKKNLHRVRYIEGVCEKSTKVLFAWVPGSAIVLVTNLLMLRQAGTQCPGSMWKNYLPHRLNKSRATVFVSLSKLTMNRVIFRR